MSVIACLQQQCGSIVNLEGNPILRLLAAAIVCIAWCAVGFVMAFRPELYRRWAESSWTGRHAPRMTERWLQQRWNVRILGVLFIALGVGCFVGFVSLVR
jgi:hypothetical protein